MTEKEHYPQDTHVYGEETDEDTDVYASVDYSQRRWTRSRNVVDDDEDDDDGGDVNANSKPQESSNGAATAAAASTTGRAGTTRWICLAVTTILVVFIWAVTMTSLYAKERNQRITSADSSRTSPTSAPTTTPPRTLQILHANDLESGFQDVNTLEEKVNYYSALVNGLRTLGYPSLHVSTGDATLRGPFFWASEEIPGLGAPGVGDMAVLNAMGLVANGIGNHELDDGLDVFATYLRAANFPMLAVNLDFSEVVLKPGTPPIQVGTDAMPCRDNPGKIVKSCYIDMQDEGIGMVGIIGLAPDDLFSIVGDTESNLPGLDFFGGRDPETNFPLIQGNVQINEQVELLNTGLGIDIIILVDHSHDYTEDPTLADELIGVDIVLSGDSTGFWSGEAFGPYNNLRGEETPIRNYPLVTQDAEGSPVLVVKADEQYRYLGNLIVTFDEDGIVESYDSRSGVLATTSEIVAELSDVLQIDIEPMKEVADILRDYRRTERIQDAFELVGRTQYYLDGNRNPIRSRETNMGRLVADSTLWASNMYAAENGLPPVDIALNNGGSIRAPIAGPSIIRITIQTALVFDGTLSIIELSAGQLIAALENSVSRAPTTDGRFPHVAGMVLEADTSKSPIEGSPENTFQDQPSRIKNLVVTTFSGTGDIIVANFTATGDLSRTFVMATNDFLIAGGDAYFAFGEATILAAIDRREQQVIEDYIVEALEQYVDIPDPPPSPKRVDLFDADTASEVSGR